MNAGTNRVARTRPCERRRTSSHVSEQLARAQRLGYLKAARLTDPSIHPYLEWCHEHGRPAVLLYNDRAGAAAIIYRLPYPFCVLTDQAAEQMRQRAGPLEAAPRGRRTVITSVGGEITALRRDRAEELAFWIGDAASDPEQTRTVADEGRGHVRFARC